MKYLKTFESYSLNEELVPGGGGAIGAMVGGSRKSSKPIEEEPSDKPDEFLLEVKVNPTLGKWGKYNCKLVDCKMEKIEPKKSFFGKISDKIFSESSSIKLRFQSDLLKQKVLVVFKFKGDKFVRIGDPRSETLAYGYVVSDHIDKFLKYLLTQSQWKSELKENFEDIEKILTKESFNK